MICCLCAATKLEEAWYMVVTSLYKYDISCTMNQVERTITLSTTGVTKEDPDAFDKACYLLEFLTTSNVPLSLAHPLLALSYLITNELFYISSNDLK